MEPSNPWERTVPSHRSGQEAWYNENSRGASLRAGGLTNTGSDLSANTPPPVPPRPVNTSSMNYGLGSSMTNPYYSSTSFPSYYGYGGGYNRLPYVSPMYGQPDTGDLTRFAEEHSRNAFQSIESIVQAFSSVSMMLESTLSAVYSSFRAVVGVADQFSRLKLQLSQMITTLAVVRFLRWLWRRLLVLLRLRPASANVEQFWNQAGTAETAAQILSQHASGTAGGNWASLVFFAFALGGPYLIWKLVSRLVQNVKEQKQWATGGKPHFLAVALYDFHASSNGELSIRAGQRLRLAPKELQPQVRGWILGSIDGSAIGLVPANYIKILGKQDICKQSTAVRPVMSNETKSVDLERLFDESMTM